MTARTLRHCLALAAITLPILGCASAEGPAICDSLPGTAAEIAATPRDDENLELLALRLSDGVTADEAVYQRLTRDVAAIRAQAPELGNLSYRPPYADTLLLVLDSASYQAAKENRYGAWECLNRHLRVVEASPSDPNSVSVTFKGRYNLDKVAVLYKRLPGVTLAQPAQTMGDGPTIYVTENSSGWHYVFDNASGDCVVGCFAHDAQYFAVGDDGVPRFNGRWISSEQAVPPPWAETYLLTTKARWLDERLAMSR